MPPQRKRKRSSSVNNRPYKKRKSMPRTTYNSMVPLRTGGYRPNRTEKKVLDILISDINVNTTGSVILLCNPTLGSDMTNRIGRKINIKSLYIRGIGGTEWGVGSGLAGTNLAVPGQLHRMMIVYDAQPNGATPAITQILTEAHAASHLNINNRDRFKILCDKTWTVGPVSTSSSIPSNTACDPQVYQIKKYKKLNCEVIFNSTNGGTIADINTGALFMVWIGSQTSGSNVDGMARLSTRIRFDDI